MRTWPGLAERVAGRHEDARGSPAARPARRRRSPGGRPTRSWPGCRRPRSRARAGLGDQLRALLARAPGCAPRSAAVRAAERLQRARLGDLRDAEVGVELGQQLLRAGARRSHSRCAGPPGPTPSRSCGTRAAAGTPPAAPARSRCGWASAKSTSASSSSTPTPSGSPSSRRSAAPARGEQLAGRVVGARQRDHAHVAARGRPPAAPSTPPATRSGRPWARLAISGNSGIGGPRRQQPLAGLDQRAGGRAQQLGGAVAEDQPLRAARRGARRARSRSSEPLRWG